MSNPFQAIIDHIEDDVNILVKRGFKDSDRYTNPVFVKGRFSVSYRVHQMKDEWSLAYQPDKNMPHQVLLRNKNVPPLLDFMDGYKAALERAKRGEL